MWWLFMSEINSVFKEILETTIRDSSKGTRFSTFSEDNQKQLAVVAALELIKADVSSSNATAAAANAKPTNLFAHMENLSLYRDLILKAMNDSKQD